ncbi:MAG TPA: hypothetical protein DD379_24945 [Cyanobacteria bacterium UBA11162]|nr:hypothetical protein [Cyanobacteria bacterium UBA11162]
MQARVAKLPETNLLQTRPIAPPFQELSQPPDTRSVEERIEGAAQFGYNTSDIPVQAPEAPPPPPPVQSKIGGWYQPPIQRANPVLNQLNLLREEQSSQPETEEQQDVSMRHSSSGIGEETAGTQNQLAQAESNQWQTIDISAAIKYNQTRYSQETITVIQHRLGVAITGEFNEETVLAIAKWQQEKKLAEIDGKIGYGTRESLGITQRLFDDKKGYGVDYFPGQPFVGEVGDQDQIDPNDVAQGDLGNCYFSAAMVAVARANPSLIRELIKDNGDGSYNVTLYTEKGSQIIKVTPYFPATGQGPAYAGFGDESELWPMLLEKAYAQYTEGYGETGKGAGGYDLIGEGGRPGDAVKVLTGPIPQEYKEKYQVEDVYWVKEVDWRELVRGINLSLKENWAVTAVTIDPPDGEGKIPKEGKKKIGEQGIYFDHAYVIDAIYRTEEGELTPDNVFLNLLNPWGKEHIQGLSIRLFQEYFATLYINPISQRNVDQKVPVTQAESEQSSSNEPETDSVLSEEDRSILQEVISQLQDFSRPVAEFVAGAIYQYIYDNGGIARWVLQIFPEWRELEEGVEQQLPDSWAFNLGRVAGDGAAIITGIAEIIGGGGTAAGGGTVCLVTAGGGCIVGAPAVAVGLAVAGHGGATALEGARNIIKHLGVVFHSTTGDNDEDIWAELDELNNPTVEDVARTPDGWILSTHAEVDSLARHGITLRKVDDIIRNATRKTTQSDGATVFIEIIGSQRNRSFNIVIVNEQEQKIVTALKNQSPKQIERLAGNQGWNPNQASWTIIER